MAFVNKGLPDWAKLFACHAARNKNRQNDSFFID
jgi:hypothetical protein